MFKPEEGLGFEGNVRFAADSDDVDAGGGCEGKAEGIEGKNEGKEGGDGLEELKADKCAGNSVVFDSRFNLSQSFFTLVL